jgi:nucleoside-diphosphate-sugar epimerase
MGNTYFVTGYPGFIASNLIKSLASQDYDINKIYLLVLPDMIPKAKEDLKNILQNSPLSPLNVNIIPGDITIPWLNLNQEDQSILQDSVTHVYHLAAVYDLAVPKDVAYMVNVIGTKNVNNWCKSLSNLKRYTYFSTAFVSGTREGKIYETELKMNQSFKNFYEETKYEAEVLVQKLLPSISTTIIRPGVVKGHSQTGETNKFDGPYFIFNFFERLKLLPVLPYLGDGDAEGNFVPLDYVIDATLYLSHSEKGIGKTYHLTDPNPFTVREQYKMIMEALIGKTPSGQISLSFAKRFLSASFIRKWLGVEKEAMDYFTCYSSFDASQAQEDLRDSGISCPNFKDSLKPMVDFYKKNKRNKALHIKIR